MAAGSFGHKSVSKPDGSTADAWFSYTCGHCGDKVSGAVVARVSKTQGGYIRWLQCSNCHDGSVNTDSGTIHPGAAFGPSVLGLPKDVASAYQEVRHCMSVNALTAAESLCRKILMHVAVDKGAKEGDTFASYIDFLLNAGYVTPPMKDWVDLIKKHGNEASHRLEAPNRERAEGSVYFTAQLLRTVYEMAHLAAKFAPQPKP